MYEAGFVLWPLGLPKAGPGCRVFAVVPAETAGEGPAFPYAPEGTARPHTDLPLLGFSAESARDSYTDLRRTQGHELLVAVRLGASPVRFQALDGAPWACTRADLTPEGRSLLDLLERLTGCAPHLVTLFDS
jgi:hypothetical protein